jgi:hypothetical protein
MTTTLDISKLDLLTTTTATFDDCGEVECEVAPTSSNAYEFHDRGPKAFASPVLLDQESL